VNLRTSAPVLAFHVHAVPSFSAVTTSLPSGLNSALSRKGAAVFWWFSHFAVPKTAAAGRLRLFIRQMRTR
jgi:hypothetical protein